MSATTQALLAAAAPRPGPDGQGVLEASLARLDAADWAVLVQQALSHGMAALLCRSLLGADPNLVPADVAAAGRAYLDVRAAAATEALDELAALVDALAAAGMPALPLKGPVLGCQAYGSPALRGFRDLDVLIRPEHVPSALEILAGLGYRSAVTGLSPRRLRDYHRYNGQDILFAPDKLPVEPHWALAPRTLGAELDAASFFVRAGTIRLPAGGRELPCLAAEDALLAAALHGAKEQWTRLLCIADVAALLRSHPALDWHAVLARAAEAGCRRMVLLAAALARDVLRAELPDGVEGLVAADGAVARLAACVREALPVSKGDGPSVFKFSAFRWQVRERPADRLRYAARTLLTARVAHYRTVDLPDRLSFLYPAVRIGHDFVALPLWKALRRADR